MDFPLVSIIIPVYKAEKYIRRGLDSLLMQTDPRWEALCINDGSPDNSAAILEEYAQKDSRIRVFSQKNMGVSSARNRGIAEAHGDFISFLDADDKLAEDIVEMIISTMQREEVDIVIFDALLEYEQGIPRTEWLENALRLKQKGQIKSGPDTIGVSIGTCWGKAYRTDLLRRYGILFPLNMRQEDEVFYRCCMAMARDLYLIPQIGYYYLQTPDSFMHSGQSACDAYLSYVKGMNIVHDFYRQYNRLPAWEETLVQFLFSLMASMQPYVSSQKLRDMRRSTSTFLAKTEIPAHFKQDYRLRYISYRSPLRDLFIDRRREGELYGLGKLRLLKIKYKNDRFEGWATPIGKLMRWLSKINA